MLTRDVKIVRIQLGHSTTFLCSFFRIRRTESACAASDTPALLARAGYISVRGFRNLFRRCGVVFSVLELHLTRSRSQFFGHQAIRIWGGHYQLQSAVCPIIESVNSTMRVFHVSGPRLRYHPRSQHVPTSALHCPPFFFFATLRSPIESVRFKIWSKVKSFRLPSGIVPNPFVSFLVSAALLLIPLSSGAVLAYIRHRLVLLLAPFRQHLILFHWFISHRL